VAGSLLLALASLALVLLLLEVGIRVFERVTRVDLFHVSRGDAVSSPDTDLRFIDLIRVSENAELIYELAPLLRGRFQGAPIETDASGMRVPTSDPVFEGPLRIVGIGDSHTFGWGVSWSDTFLARLAERFRDEHPGEPGVSVANLGVPGYNTHQEAEVLVEKALRLEPAVVVLLASKNDAGLANFVRARPDPWRLDRSYLADFVEIRLKHLLRAEGFRNRHVQRGLVKTRSLLGENFIHDVGSAELAAIPAEMRHAAGFDAVDRAIDRIASVSVARGVPVVLAFYEEPGETPLRRRMLDRAAALGVAVADLAAPIERYLLESGAAADTLYLSESDPHPTPLHHRLIADALYEQHVRAWLLAAAARGGD
jgi:lysophospholipase L1-like esterase